MIPRLDSRIEHSSAGAQYQVKSEGLRSAIAFVICLATVPPMARRPRENISVREAGVVSFTNGRADLVECKEEVLGLAFSLPVHLEILKDKYRCKC